MNCSHCYKEIPADSVFCCYCGTVLKRQEMPSVSSNASADDALNDGPTFGIHLNWAILDLTKSRSAPKAPKWLHGFQSSYWEETGVVIWDKAAEKVTQLHAAQALQVLHELQNDLSWMANGVALDEPATMLYIHPNARQEMEGHSQSKSHAISTYQIQLSSAQTLELLRFLKGHEDILQEIAVWEQEERVKVLSKVYRLILSWKNKKQSITE